MADLTQLMFKITADSREAEAALKALEGDAGASMEKIGSAFGVSVPTIDQMGASIGKSRAEVSNLAAQFQDIGVQLAGGQSPFLIALQQGTQVSAVLGDKGLKGVVGLLGGAFASIVSPVSLATIAIIALGGAAIQYLSTMGSDVEDVDTALKEHADLIRSLKDAYGDALEGVEEYGKASKDVLELRARTSIVAVRQQVADLSGELERSLSGGPLLNFLGVAGRVKEEFRPLASIIEEFRQTVRDGNPDVIAFRNSVAALAEGEKGGAFGHGDRIRELAEEVLGLAESAVTADERLRQLVSAMALSQAAASGLIGSAKELSDALKDLSVIALPKLTERDEAAAALKKGLANTSGMEERQALLKSYDDTLGRIAAREKERADEEAAAEAKRLARSGARSAARDAERDAERIQDVIEGLKFEQEQLGRTAEEQYIYNSLKAAGVAINTQYGQTIAEEARKTFRLSEEVAAANEKMEEMKALAADVLGGFLHDLKSGETAADAFANALDRIADRLIDMAVNKLVESAFSAKGPGAPLDLQSPSGGAGGFLGGILGAFKGLFGRAGGGPVMAGDAYRVGERGEEVFIPDVSGRILPNHKLQRSGGSAPVVNVQIINNTGSEVSTRQSGDGSGLNLEVLVDQAVSRKIGEPGSASSKSMRQTFGLAPKLTRR